ncbi:hypothetical protein SARC_11523 [Sphaeroforma arctica JP610]|uniref:Uncharacterized protein n=1 Tax=Sphaeroforma arctica JP610 TaxID=667725 RepID=A0A0L0FIV3_9EUKA|nr:hypothetical protein SARC_11523 [Sphaeroforma arctica JP610]KNC75963.1 hypothetical protein SARC_11523 [Sphaeroforma arctica JP610]|eukprot:XP_014149865.1 hypothetical protein SARC_11523 [Sphaeroforma arctica JP610]
MEREVAKAAAATAAAEATAAAAEAFNRTVAEALVSGNNSPDNASDKDVATPIKETTPAEKARGPTIASTSKLAFPKPRDETRDTSQDAQLILLMRLKRKVLNYRGQRRISEGTYTGTRRGAKLKWQIRI